MPRLATLAVLLFAFWLLLSGEFKTWLLIVGLISTGICVWLAARMKVADEEGLPIRLTLGAITYWPWLVAEIVKSAFAVTRIILDPRLPIAPTMVRIKGSQKSTVGLTTYANSITLTPGTISVEVSGRSREILVHALTADHARELEEGTMNRRVVKFEGGRQ
jgi:multicomponent Na+:H+ antiporter subunit E